jgi:type II secretory pathway component GspD/PulD (secretin)
MRWNAIRAVRGPLCAFAAACAVFVMLSDVRALAQVQGAEQPAPGYQTIHLKYMTEQREMSDVVTDLRNMLPRARMYAMESANAISIQGSADEIATAQRIVAEIDRPRQTYRLTYTIGERNGGQRFVLIATPRNRTTLKHGSRVPIMTGAHKDGTAQDSEIQYVDVGVMIEASLVGVGDGMRLHTKIEQTSVAEEKSNVGIQDPVIHQSVLDADTAITLDAPIALGSVDVPNGRHLEVRVMAEAVK